MRRPEDMTILVVDDEIELRDAIVFDFKRRGFVVLVASNGAEAFELVKNNKIDLVITDVRMPGGDGVELLDNIKALHPELPVVMFITGFADISLEESYNKGADAVFSKPFDRKELIAAVITAMTVKDELWGSRKIERLDFNFKIELKFPELNLPELNSAIQGEVINIGRGGIFVSLDKQFPSLGAKADFSIQFEHGSPKIIDGHGVVRWVRRVGVEGMPSGCGIEFEYLSDQSRSQVIELINTLKTKAFIPLS